MGRKAGLAAFISGAQIGFVLLAGAVLLWGARNELAAISLFLGGTVGILAGLFIAIKVFQRELVTTSVFLRRYYSGHMLKLVFIALMLTAIFKFLAVDALWVISGLCITQIVYLIILPFVKRL